MTELKDVPRRKRRFYRNESIPEKEVYSFEKPKEIEREPWFQEMKGKKLPEEKNTELDEFKKKIEESKEEKPKTEEILHELKGSVIKEEEPYRPARKYEIAEEIAEELTTEEKEKMVQAYAKRELKSFKEKKGRLPKGRELDLMSENIYQQLKKEEEKNKPAEEISSEQTESPRERIRRRRMQRNQQVIKEEPKIETPVKELLSETSEIKPLEETEESEEKKETEEVTEKKEETNDEEELVKLFGEKNKKEKEE